MRCPSCGFENPDGMKFCGQCASPLGRRCPQCGFANPPGFAFCGQCATSLTKPPAASLLQAPLSYTPTHLAEKILASRTALEGERKQVTVLFADLKGSMELLADRDPEDARAMLDPVLERMMDAVHRYEGTVNQVMGDGIMALFGAPIAHEDHAVRACYAALAMQASVKQYAVEVQRTRGVPIHIRVGLNSGEVVVRTIGNDLHMDYSAIGQTAHLAARMEQLATPGSILLTIETFRLVEGLAHVNGLGPVPVKGLAEPVEVCELLGAEPTRRRFQAVTARGLTSFVGRETELEQLRQALERARAGHGQVVAIVGEPGVGKSRLVYEFTRSPRTQGWLLLESGSVSYGKATSYLPVIDLLKSYCGIEARDDSRKIREKVTGKLLTLDDALKSSLPAVLALLDMPVDDPTWQVLDPAQRRQRTLGAIRRLLLRESQTQPLLLVCEDLHWIDAETQALLDGLVESLPASRLLLLVNYRPEYQHAWGRKTYYHQLRLDPLVPESAEALLQALLGHDASLAPLKQLLIARTEGNPFFLEESVRTLVETKALVGERGSYRLAQVLSRIQVPATVQTVLSARIDRLPPDEKRLLQVAAVIGNELPLALLQAIAERPEEALRRDLSHLQAAEFLYETSLFPELVYSFKHALTHEVAYGSLLQDRRRSLHARIVTAIEGRYPDRLAEQVERLAHRAFRGEVWDKALTYYRQAGAKAAHRSAHREAVTCFEQALVALRHLPESREMREQAIDLRLNLRGSLQPLGELRRMLDHLHEAETLATALGDQRRLGQVSAIKGQYCWLVGNQEQAIDLSQRALTIAETLQDFELRVVSTYYLGAEYHALGDYQRAMGYLKQAAAFLEGDPFWQHLGSGTLISVVSRVYLVWALAEVGAFAEGINVGEEAIRIAEAFDQPFSRIAAYFAVGLLSVRKGELDKAIAVLERGLGLAQSANIPFWCPRVGAALGLAYTLAGRGPEALPLLEQAVEQGTAVGMMVFQALWVACLAEASWLAGHVTDAIALGERALALSHQHKERGHEAWALRLLGEIAAQADPPEVELAEVHCPQALTLAEELGMRPLVAHCHRGLGTLYATIGRAEQARAELSTAIELYRAMQMTFWLPQAEAALAQVEAR